MTRTRGSIRNSDLNTIWDTLFREQKCAYVLNWINQRRLNMGLPYLSRIPVGYRGSPYACPMTRALNATMVRTGHAWWWSGRSSGRAHKIQLPSWVALWIQEFDLGYYPEYEKIRRSF